MKKVAKVTVVAALAAVMTVGGVTGNLPFFNEANNNACLVANATWDNTAYRRGCFSYGFCWTNWISVTPTNSRNSCTVKVGAYQQNGRCNRGKFEVQIYSSDGRYVTYKYIEGSGTIQLNYGYNGYNLRIRRRRTDDDSINESRTIYWAVTEAGWNNITSIEDGWNRR